MRKTSRSTLTTKRKARLERLHAANPVFGGARLLVEAMGLAVQGIRVSRMKGRISLQPHHVVHRKG
jgi:hypothetical protein